MNNTDNIFYVIKEDGIRTSANILSKLHLNSNDYIAYTFNEINENEMIKIYVTGIEKEGSMYSYREIISEEEWNNIKEILKSLARDEIEPFPENIKSDLKLIGEEVSIRRPKKLLVSQKFAKVLASKYVEDEQEIEEKSIEIKPLEELRANIEVPAEELEKTIKIPTFEELQARSKNIQAVMDTAKVSNVVEEPIVEPKIIEPEVKPEIITPSYESRVKKVDYEEQFKKDIEPVLLDVYAKQQKHIEELEEELSKTKFDLFEKQKEALSLSNEKKEMEKRSNELENQLNGVQAKMNGILEVLQGNRKGE